MQELISTTEAMKALGISHTTQLKRLVDQGSLKRITLKRFKRRWFYDKGEVEALANQWRKESEQYIIVA